MKSTKVSDLRIKNKKIIPGNKRKTAWNDKNGTSQQEHYTFKKKKQKDNAHDIQTVVNQ